MADEARIIPEYPELLSMPIAHDGDRQALPVTTESAGKASQAQGFPAECSKPLELNGVPPMRTDMNGILNLLSQWIFYAQSGGMAKWDPTANYPVPALISHKGIAYTALKENGPATTDGVKEPGASGSELFWIAGLGEPAGAIYGNNANLYIKQGIHWIDDNKATSNFPRANIGGWLSVLSHGSLVHQSFFCRDNTIYTYMRTSANGGASWLAWVKLVYASELYNGAYTQIFMSTAAANDAYGKNGDLWYTYI